MFVVVAVIIGIVILGVLAGLYFAVVGTRGLLTEARAALWPELQIESGEAPHFQ